MNLSRWRTEAQRTDEDQSPPADFYSDDEGDVLQQASATQKQNAAVSVDDNQPARGQPSTAPRVRVIDDVDDTDIWAEISNSQPVPPPTQEQSQANDDPDDFEDWFALDDGPVPSFTPKSTLSVPNEEPLDFGEHGINTITDDEVDALFAHMDETMAIATPHPPLPTEDDFEDMYN